MKWRTKQNLDYAYLMLYCQDRASYYLQIEDDVITRPHVFASIKDFIAEKSKVPWLVLEFSTLGYIGKLFRSTDLPLSIQIILKFYREKPVDWLLEDYIKLCSTNTKEKAKRCRLRHKKPLFQHIGLQSSLAGKIQKLKEQNFVLLYVSHEDNPKAKATTSLQVYKTHSLQSAYDGEDFFWSKPGEAGDWLNFDLTPPTPIASLRLRSGNPEHVEDRLYNASVYCRYARGSRDWLELGPVDADGAVIVDLPRPSAPLRSLKILIESKSDHWLILSEIWFREYEVPFPTR